MEYYIEIKQDGIVEPYQARIWKTPRGWYSQLVEVEWDEDPEGPYPTREEAEESCRIAVEENYLNNLP